MKSHLTKLLLLFSAFLIINISANSQAEHKTSLPDSVFFKSLVNQYKQSIELADTALAAKVWSPTSEISFINPQGTEYGWKEIKNIYEMFSKNFTTRKLTFFNLKSTYYGDISWVTFYWTFYATLKSDNSTLKTNGRETQIWRKVNYEWHLVHVHNSGMPIESQSAKF
jgi:hypothetical protein